MGAKDTNQSTVSLSGIFFAIAKWCSKARANRPSKFALWLKLFLSFSFQPILALGLDASKINGKKFVWL